MDFSTIQLKARTIKRSNFRMELRGKTLQLYRLKNTNGVEITFTNFGQKLVSLIVPDKEGIFEDIVLGFANIEDYVKTDEIYFGSVIGRYGNRIANGTFEINREKYTLETNNGPNHLHGGNDGFHNKIWDTEVISGTEIQFTRVSKNGEEGYPGNLMTRVHYELTEANELKINYYAITDKATVVNLTHHSYFNLAGEGNGDINDHIFLINADKYTPVNENLIPTGELASVKNTPFDFTEGKTIGQDVNQAHEQLQYANGYDHNFVLNDIPKTEEGLKHAAKVRDPKTGRVLEVFTNEPGMQLYGGNFLSGKTIGKSGKNYAFRGAFCLETQHFPDSPNQPHFPSTVLLPNEQYKSTCIYKFSVEP